MHKLVSAAAHTPKNLKKDDDFADRLSHRYTVILLVIFALVIVTRQYQGSAITCWTPAHFTGSHVKYTHSYCWIKNNYRLPWTKNIDISRKMSPPAEIVYYQWLPFILLLQAVFFYLPSVVWHGLNSKSGVDADNILAAAIRYLTLADKESNEECSGAMRLIVNQIHRFLGNPKKKKVHRETSDMNAKVGKLRFAVSDWRCGQKLGNYLSGLFIVCKLLYIGNIALQIVILNSVLNTNYVLFGWEMILEFMTGKPADYNREIGNSTVFPYVTICDMDGIRRLGNSHDYSLQCVLPVNMYAEKIYVVLWVWMIFILIISIYSLVIWMGRCCLFRDRINYIESQLIRTTRLHQRGQHSYSGSGHVNRADSAALYQFVDSYLRQDGVFLLRLIAQNTNGWIASQISAALWDHWQSKVYNYQPTLTPSGGESPKLRKEDAHDEYELSPLRTPGMITSPSSPPPPITPIK